MPAADKFAIVWLMSVKLMSVKLVFVELRDNELLVAKGLDNPDGVHVRRRTGSHCRLTVIL